ncbi:uncharacterized protein LOC117175328 [Belonocnema kinseyi]|uniref:uncharacterized protein LOC117175328 n=1 Tax=Belonocnema kinseyi TaxID=2817044 RepID=UPI00143CFDD0|nr:uncharacterized protein LOC117175328 [Belonocnema kinseyi]
MHASSLNQNQQKMNDETSKRYLQELIIQKRRLMYIGQVQSTVFQYLGLWRPQTWNSLWRIWIYRIYSILMITNYSLFIFSMLTYLLRDTSNIFNNMETLFQFSSLFTVGIKMITIMVKRKPIIDSTCILLDKLCQPRDLHELKILQSCSKVCRSNTIILQFMYIVSVFLVLLTPLSKRSNFPLPFKIWIPYSIESRFAYFSIYFCHGVVGITSAFISASVESLAMVIMLQIYAQLEIIVHRLHLLPRLRKKDDSEYMIYQHESRLMKDCVNHHTHTCM